MFRVLETSGSAKATGFAAAQCLAAAFIAIALMVGCADIRRGNIEPPPAGVQLQDEGIAETVSHGNAASAPASDDELQEVVTTGQRRKPLKPSTQPGEGSSTPAAKANMREQVGEGTPR